MKIFQQTELIAQFCPHNGRGQLQPLFRSTLSLLVPQRAFDVFVRQDRSGMQPRRIKEVDGYLIGEAIIYQIGRQCHPLAANGNV